MLEFYRSLYNCNHLLESIHSWTKDTLPNRTLSYPTLPGPLPFPTLPFYTLPYPSLTPTLPYPCSALPYPTLPLPLPYPACPIKAKFHMEPPWVGGTTVCSGHLCHMTKMAATPIHSKNPSKIFFYGPISTKLGMHDPGLLPIIVCSNDDTGVTLTYFMARSNLETGFS